MSDNGSQFISDCMKEVSRLINIRHIITTPYHPMCNGLVEKFNGTLKAMLRKMCSEQPKQWPRYINAVLFAYREVPQASTGFSPFELLYGRTVRGPIQILKELWTKEVQEEEVKTSYQYVVELRERLDQTLKIAKETLENSQARYKKYFDKKAKDRSFQPGDHVLVLLPTNNNKLLMQWKGPYNVEKIVNRNDYLINMGTKSKVYHANLLRKYLKNEERDFVKDVKINELLKAAAGDVGEESEEELLYEEGLLEICSVSSKENYKDVKVSPKLTSTQKDELESLIHEFRPLFTDKPGSTRLIEHSINLTNDVPVKSKPYSVPYGVRESLRSDIQEMQDLAITRVSNSPYASPVVIVKKKDGSNRICVDYRKLNKLTVFDPEPMVAPEDLFRKLNEDKYFSKIDLSKGYWQVPVAENDIHKTAFVTPDGSYEFLKMPFGMVNSAATLLRAMRKLLAGLDNVDSYIDDILIHTRTWEEHILTLRDLFSRMLKWGMTARPSKCTFGGEIVEFIGHQVGRGELSLHDENVKKVRDAQRPRTKKEVKSFLGLTGYYRNFIPNYAAIASPLSDLTKKGLPNEVDWQDIHEKAYRTLKKMTVTKPVLRLPDITKPFTLRTDASNTGIGAVLLQEHDGQLFPVSYASKKLLMREQAYSTIEKECFAIVWAIKKFMLYLYGTEFVIQTDHQPLVYLNKTKFVNDRIMRWAMFMQSYKFKVESIKGSENVGADFLSRVI